MRLDFRDGSSAIAIVFVPEPATFTIQPVGAHGAGYLSPVTLTKRYRHSEL